MEQGDLLLGCPVFLIPPEAAREPGNHVIQVQSQNAITMTQSCDLVHRKDGKSHADDVILSPVYFKEELKDHKTYGKNEGWEEARKGRHPGYHVLNHCQVPSHELDFMLVDLRRIYTLSVGVVRAFAADQGERLRLLPPYREHLSQAFARFFMRVGLPVDITPFK